MVWFSLNNRGKLTTHFSSNDVRKATGALTKTILFLFSCSIFVAICFELIEQLFNLMKKDFDGHGGWVGLISVLVWILIFGFIKEYLFAFYRIVFGIGTTIFLAIIMYTFFNLMSVDIRPCSSTPEFQFKNVPAKTRFLVFTLENRSDNKKYFENTIEYKGQKTLACGELLTSTSQGIEWGTERKDWRWEIKALDGGQNQLGLAYK